jgi:hypothetical protein
MKQQKHYAIIERSESGRRAVLVVDTGHRDAEKTVQRCAQSNRAAKYTLQAYNPANPPRIVKQYLTALEA